MTTTFFYYCLVWLVDVFLDALKMQHKYVFEGGEDCLSLVIVSVQFSSLYSIYTVHNGMTPCHSKL